MCDFASSDNDDDWESPDDDWGETTITEFDELKIDINQINLNTNEYEVSVDLFSLSNLICIYIGMFSEILKVYTNITLEVITLKIIYDHKFNIQSIRVFCNNEKPKETDILILCKIEKIIKNMKLNVTDNFIPKICKRLMYYFQRDIFYQCYICDKCGVVDKNIFDDKLILNLCGDLLCICNSFISQNFIVEEEIMNHPCRLELMLYLFIYSCNVNRLPCILPDNTNLNEVLEILSTLPQLNELKNIKNLKSNLNPQLYSILSWLIFTYVNKIRLNNENRKELVFNIIENNEIKDKIFKQAESNKILNKFHGSSDFNYFNILMNGLQSFSKTKYQTNGAAYGNGVYFGNKNTASSYNNTSKVYKNKNKDKINELLESYTYSKNTKILNCNIYYENPKWHNNSFCTVIPKSENIQIIQFIILK